MNKQKLKQPVKQRFVLDDPIEYQHTQTTMTNLTLDEVFMRFPIPVYLLNAPTSVNQLDPSHPEYNLNENLKPSCYIEFSTTTIETYGKNKPAPKTTDIPKPTSTPANTPLGNIFKTKNVQKQTTSYTYETKTTPSNNTLNMYIEKKIPIYSYDFPIPRTLPRSIFLQLLADMLNSNKDIQYHIPINHTNITLFYSLPTKHYFKDEANGEFISFLSIGDVIGLTVYVQPAIVNFSISTLNELSIDELLKRYNQYLLLSKEILNIDITNFKNNVVRTYLAGCEFDFQHQTLINHIDSKTNTISPFIEQSTYTGYTYGPVKELMQDKIELLCECYKLINKQHNVEDITFFIDEEENENAVDEFDIQDDADERRRANMDFEFEQPVDKEQKQQQKQMFKGGSLKDKSIEDEMKNKYVQDEISLEKFNRIDVRRIINMKPILDKCSKVEVINDNRKEGGIKQIIRRLKTMVGSKEKVTNLFNQNSAILHVNYSYTIKYVVEKIPPTIHESISSSSTPLTFTPYNTYPDEIPRVISVDLHTNNELDDVHDNYNDPDVKRLDFKIKRIQIRQDGTFTLSIAFHTPIEYDIKILNMIQYYLTVDKNLFFKTTMIGSLLNTFAFDFKQYKIILRNVDAIVNVNNLDVDYSHVTSLFSLPQFKVIYNCNSSRNTFGFIYPSNADFENMAYCKYNNINVSQNVVEMNLAPKSKIKNKGPECQLEFEHFNNINALKITIFAILNGIVAVDNDKNKIQYTSDDMIEYDIINKIADKYSITGKRHLKLLVDTDPVLFGPRVINGKTVLYSQLVSLNAQRPKLISRDDYNIIQNIMSKASAAIPNTSKRNDMMYLYCADKEFPVLNFHEFKHRLCVPKCTKVLHNIQQFQRCATSLNISTNAIEYIAANNDETIKFDYTIGLGIPVAVPSEFETVMPKKYCVKIKTNRIKQFCLKHFNMLPLVLEYEEDTQNYKIMSSYDEYEDYCIVLKLFERDAYFIIINQPKYQDIEATELRSLPVLESIIKKNYTRKEESIVYTYVRWLTRLLDPTDYPNHIQDIHNRVIFVVKNDKVCGFLYKYVYFSVPLSNVEVEMTYIVYSKKVLAELQLRDKRELERKLGIHSKIDSAEQGMTLMNHICPDVYRQRYRISYPKLSIFRVQYIKQIYVGYDDNKIHAIRYNDVVEYVNDDLWDSELVIEDGKSKIIIDDNHSNEFHSKHKDIKLKDHVHPFLFKYPNIKLHYIDSATKYTHLSSKTKLKPLAQTNTFINNRYINELVNYTLKIYSSYIFHHRCSFAMLMSKCNITSKDIIMLMKILGIVGSGETFFAKYKLFQTLNYHDSTVEESNVERYLATTVEDGYNFETFNTSLYYYYKQLHELIETGDSVLQVYTD